MFEQVFDLFPVFGVNLALIFLVKGALKSL
jgi:hypothetical protein